MNSDEEREERIRAWIAAKEQREAEYAEVALRDPELAVCMEVAYEVSGQRKNGDPNEGGPPYTPITGEALQAILHGRGNLPEWVGWELFLDKVSEVEGWQGERRKIAASTPR